jgi:hypothetical protein
MKVYKDLTNEEIDRMENLYIKSFLMVKDIAKIFNVKPAVVFYACCGLKRINYTKNYNREVPRGEESYLSKLTEENVKNIIFRLLKGERQWTIAKDYGVNQSTISCIKTGQTWKALWQKQVKLHKFNTEVIKESQ